MITHRMIRSIAGLFVLLVMIVLLAPASAQPKPEILGNWTWTEPGTFGTTGRPGARTSSQPTTQRSREVTLEITHDGEKFAGQLHNFGPAPLAMQDVTFKDGELSFKLIQAARFGGGYNYLYKGKLAGDTITGTIDTGGRSPREWTAKRVKP